MPGSRHTFFTQSSQVFKVGIISVLHVRKLRLRVVVICLIFFFKASDGAKRREVDIVEMAVLMGRGGTFFLL